MFFSKETNYVSIFYVMLSKGVRMQQIIAFRTNVKKATFLQWFTVLRFFSVFKLRFWIVRIKATFPEMKLRLSLSHSQFAHRHACIVFHSASNKNNVQQIHVFSLSKAVTAFIWRWFVLSIYYRCTNCH